VKLEPLIIRDILTCSMCVREILIPSWSGIIWLNPSMLIGRSKTFRLPRTFVFAGGD
jgi:hypothetical protein